MKILTFNIWDTPLWISVKRKERVNRLGAYLKSHDPDIICLQESFDTRNRERIHRDLGKKTYHSTNQDSDMRRVFYFSRMDKTGGLVIFSKFPIKESLFTPFKLPILVSPQERIGRKGFLIAELETPKGNVLVINTHLYSIHSVHGSGIRMYQLRQILEKTKEKRKLMPCFLGGDLNEHKMMEKEPFKTKLHEEEFYDSTELTGEEVKPSYRPENPLTRARFNNGTNPLRLDCVLLSGLSKMSLSIASNDVLSQPDEPLSDHDPVMITLS
ncbi:hypothetical protein A3A21_03105 [Candidatus Jorgensenbacteria bacterium RIFCSPLOWO2_01_FULL_45_25b]|uniref:Endonuclease/exonuclease/phosphatase domain-containing protein n=1 Tax=Candidatus Jorgensenbacteria bacterium RIFCSPLOWO2_01_FULL_45_25b TaxID=1798471 RepID=A0A1F6BVZ4_9BACT|nr:MAG: hypothetical protein A3A21_03105 [Candidatus Jorgensenbacteria bacterium RIFCSPLOWO2_01_FULL_45_25b]